MHQDNIMWPVACSHTGIMHLAHTVLCAEFREEVVNFGVLGHNQPVVCRLAPASTAQANDSGCVRAFRT